MDTEQCIIMGDANYRHNAIQKCDLVLHYVGMIPQQDQMTSRQESNSPYVTFRSTAPHPLRVFPCVMDDAPAGNLFVCTVNASRSIRFHGVNTLFDAVTATFAAAPGSRLSTTSLETVAYEDESKGRMDSDS